MFTPLCRNQHRVYPPRLLLGIVETPAPLYYGCSHAWIVTSSTFSVNAVALTAKDPTISLVDGRALTKLCEQFKTVQVPDFSWGEWEKIKDVAERFA
jgi:Restriction endonuclease